MPGTWVSHAGRRDVSTQPNICSLSRDNSQKLCLQGSSQDWSQHSTLGYKYPKQYLNSLFHNPCNFFLFCNNLGDFAADFYNFVSSMIIDNSYFYSQYCRICLVHLYKEEKIYDNSIVSSLYVSFLFALFISKTVWERRNRGKVFSSVVLFTNGRSSQSWSRLGARNSSWVSHMDERGLSTWVIFYHFPRSISRNLEHELVLLYGMWAS